MTEHPAANGSGRIPADTFSNRLVLARRLAGMTIEEAAAATGLSKSSWANWENGMRPQGQVDVCQAIAGALDINFEWLLLGGALTPSGGRPTKRSGSVTATKPNLTVRPPDTRPNVRVDSLRSKSLATTGRRAAPIW
jgi:transcriptional regulator with XRE-family HTH domain